MTKKAIYYTTPIFYPNDNLHLGHTYSAIAVDTIKKFKEFQGFDVFYTTGTDEHGEKLKNTSKDRGYDNPKDYIDPIVEDTLKLWDLLEINYDAFQRSTDPKHKKTAQDIFQKLYDKGDIYLGEYEGYYCTPCESFWTEKQLVEGNCPDCGREVHLRKEESYFFKLSKYRQDLLDLYENNENFLMPESRRHEMINNFLGEDMQDLSVSRRHLDWGIPVPFDEDHVIYVWIDALSCYLTAIGYGEDEEKFNKYWSNVTHIVGKEIVRFHAVIWPAILMGMGMDLPKQIYGHGWLLFDNDKMSKSKGNIYYPEPIIEAYGIDALRFYMLRDINFGQDGNFTREAFLTRLNSDLANDLGNLVSRTISMIDQYKDSLIPQGASNEDYDQDLKDMALGLMDKVEAHMETYQFSQALEDIWNLIKRTNKYVDETQPWIVAKEDSDRINDILYNLSESIRIISVALHPFLSHISQEIRDQMGFADEVKIEDAKIWGLTQEGTRVQKADPIFSRIDIKEEMQMMQKRNQDLIEKRKKERNVTDQSEVTNTKDTITIEDFDKLDLRVGKIVECEDHPNADKLYVLTVDLKDQTKTIVSGLKETYNKEDLVGKSVIVINNLKETKLRGVQSQGMLLAATSPTGDLTLLTTVEEIEQGSVVS